MVAAACLVLPVAPLYAKAVRLVVYSRSPRPEPSYLDQDLVPYPERAIVAVIRELQRLARICSRSLHLSAHVLMRDYRHKTVQKIKLNEKVINEVKLTMREYLGRMATHNLSRRQTIMVQHLNRCMTDIERIGDHIDESCDLSLRRHQLPQALMDRASLEWLLALYERAREVLDLIILSLDPDRKDFQETAEAIMRARDEYVVLSIATKSDFTQKILEHGVTPMAAMFFTEYITVFDRIVRHSKSIALAQKHPDFWIKRRKLHRKATEAPGIAVPEQVDPKDYLDRLQAEDYL